MARRMLNKVFTPTGVVNNVGSSVRIYLHDADEPNRVILLEMTPVQAENVLSLLKPATERASSHDANVLRADKIATLKKIVDGSFPDSMKLAAMEELETLEMSVA